MKEKQKKSPLRPKADRPLDGNKNRKKLAERQAGKEDYLLIAQRIQADFENYKRRSQQEKEEFANFANIELLLQILPILDNFKLATKHLPENLTGNNWVQGVLHIEKQLEQVVAEEGVIEIKSVGEQFDPHLHEAVEEVKSDEKEGIIVEEILKGYELKSKIIRHAKVKVSKGNKLRASSHKG